MVERYRTLGMTPKKETPLIEGGLWKPGYRPVSASVPLAHAPGSDNQDNDDDDQHRADANHSPQQVGRNDVHRGRCSRDREIDRRRCTEVITIGGVVAVVVAAVGAIAVVKNPTVQAPTIVPLVGRILHQ